MEQRVREYWEWIQKTKDPHQREGFWVKPSSWADALAWALAQMEEARREARELRLRIEELERTLHRNGILEMRYGGR